MLKHLQTCGPITFPFALFFSQGLMCVKWDFVLILALASNSLSVCLCVESCLEGLSDTTSNSLTAFHPSFSCSFSCFPSFRSLFLGLVFVSIGLLGCRAGLFTQCAPITAHCVCNVLSLRTSDTTRNSLYNYLSS